MLEEEGWNRVICQEVVQSLQFLNYIVSPRIWNANAYAQNDPTTET